MNLQNKYETLSTKSQNHLKCDNLNIFQLEIQIKNAKNRLQMLDNEEQRQDSKFKIQKQRLQKFIMTTKIKKQRQKMVQQAIQINQNEILNKQRNYQIQREKKRENSCRLQNMFEEKYKNKILQRQKSDFDKQILSNIKQNMKIQNEEMVLNQRKQQIIQKQKIKSFWDTKTENLKLQKQNKIDQQEKTRQQQIQLLQNLQFKELKKIEQLQNSLPKRQLLTQEDI